MTLSIMPHWIYLLFFLLFYLGIRACFKRVIKIQVLLILPFIFTWLSLDNLYRAANASSEHILFYLIGAVLGVYLGYYHVRKIQVRADMQQHIVQIPGDWTLLLLIMALFFVQFIIRYLLITDPSFTKNYFIAGCILAVSGLTTTIVISRNLTYFYKYTQAPHEHLKR